MDAGRRRGVVPRRSHRCLLRVEPAEREADVVLGQGRRRRVASSPRSASSARCSWRWNRRRRRSGGASTSSTTRSAAPARPAAAHVGRVVVEPVSSAAAHERRRSRRPARRRRRWRGSCPWPRSAARCGRRRRRAARRPWRIGVATKLRIAGDAFSMIGPIVEREAVGGRQAGRAARTRCGRRTTSSMSSSAGTCRYSRVTSASACCRGRSRGRGGVDQLVLGRRRLGQDAEPGERVLAVVDVRGRGTSAAGRRRGSRRSRRRSGSAARGLAAGAVARRRAGRCRGRPRSRRAPRTRSAPPAARRAAMRSLTTSCWPYTVIELPVSSTKSMRWRWPSNGDLHAVVDEALAVEALGQAEPAQQLDGRVLEHAGPDPLLHVVAVALLEHDASRCPGPPAGGTARARPGRPRRSPPRSRQPRSGP